MVDIISQSTRCTVFGYVDAIYYILAEQHAGSYHVTVIREDDTVVDETSTDGSYEHAVDCGRHIARKDHKIRAAVVSPRS